ncbi:hypothetical protein C1645_835315 [Glomus cerebriforme]|uniref:Protein kinase domain-containing protein n=1 Tax=Glomus cerebriforme TaxID=658196 RepID=A0A397SCN1_9GLOM|nr:hypothetical protein C1645_835315 [Glomus cerebriforme]
MAVSLNCLLLERTFEDSFPVVIGDANEINDNVKEMLQVPVIHRLNYYGEGITRFKILVSLVNAPKEILGYILPDDEKHCIEASISTANLNYSSEGASTDVKEFKILQELTTLNFQYIVMKPYDIANTIKRTNQNKILHRDIKPSNIILHENHEYLVDWGIAIYAQDIENKKDTYY